MSAGAAFIGSASGVLSSSDLKTWTLIPNSGSQIQQVIGDGVRLYGVVGFHPPMSSDFVYSASYNDPMTWTVMPTPGLPSPLSSGANQVDYDIDHHVLYAAIGAEGLWRIKTH
jgi:hypothetical protein